MDAVEQFLSVEEVLSPVADGPFTIVSGDVTSVNADIAVVDLLLGGQGFLPITNWYPGKGLPAVGSRVFAAAPSNSINPVLEVTSPGFMERLISASCPKIVDGSVRVMSLARKPGELTLVSVAPTTEGVDAVFEVVGRQGSKISDIRRQAAGERIEVIAWRSSLRKHIKSVFHTYECESVNLMSRPSRAEVRVPQHLIGRAAGRNRMRVQLAEQLLGVPITLRPLQP